MGSGFKGSKVKGSRFSPADGNKTAGLIEKETLKKRISNIECRSNEFCLFYKKRLSEAIPPFDILRFDIRYSAVRF